MGSHDSPDGDNGDQRSNGGRRSPSKRIERYTVAQVAKRYGVAPSTVYRWLRKGIIGGTRLGGSGPMRFVEDDLQRYERGLPPRKRHAPPAPEVMLPETSGAGVDWIVEFKRTALERHFPGSSGASGATVGE